jgi:hypothetical protein
LNSGRYYNFDSINVSLQYLEKAKAEEVQDNSSSFSEDLSKYEIKKTIADNEMRNRRNFNLNPFKVLCEGFHHL